jgi:hypothetical protein
METGTTGAGRAFAELCASDPKTQAAVLRAQARMANAGPQLEAAFRRALEVAGELLDPTRSAGWIAVERALSRVGPRRLNDANSQKKSSPPARRNEPRKASQQIWWRLEEAAKIYCRHAELKLPAARTRIRRACVAKRIASKRKGRAFLVYAPSLAFFMLLSEVKIEEKDS